MSTLWFVCERYCWYYAKEYVRALVSILRKLNRIIHINPILSVHAVHLLYRWQSDRLGSNLSGVACLLRQIRKNLTQQHWPVTTHEKMHTHFAVLRQKCCIMCDKVTWTFFFKRKHYPKPWSRSRPFLVQSLILLSGFDILSVTFQNTPQFFCSLGIHLAQWHSQIGDVHNSIFDFFP